MAKTSEKYEVLYVLNPNLTEEETAGIVEKIKVIKEVRGMLGLGLAEAKALVEGVPAKIKEAVTKEEAEEIKAKLEAVGAKVELK